MKLAADQFAESGREGDRGRIGLYCDREYASALRSGALSGWYFAKNIGG